MMELMTFEDMALNESGYKTWGTIIPYISNRNQQPGKDSDRAPRLTQSILGDQIVHHIPLSAVGERLIDEGLNEARVQIHVRRIDDLFQEVVRLLQFVPAGYMH